MKRKKEPEGDSTRRGDANTASETPKVANPRNSGGRSIPPADVVEQQVPERFDVDVKSTYEIGPNGGVMLTLEVRGSGEFVREEFFPPNDERDFYEFVAPLMSFRTAAAIMGVTKKTLYARAPYCASAVKVGGRWVFKKDPFYRIDLTEEAEYPTRNEILRDRERRAAAGEILRGGRHSQFCPRDHESKTCSTPTQKAGRNRHSKRVRNSILHKLGK